MRCVFPAKSKRVSQVNDAVDHPAAGLLEFLVHGGRLLEMKDKGAG
jgi:hypothetical protein